MEKKDSSIVILGIIAVIAVVILVLLFKQAMTGSYVYTGDKLQVVPARNMFPTPGIEPTAPTIDNRYANRQMYWEEGNRAYIIPGGPTTNQQVPTQTYPVIYEQPAWVQYPIVESPEGKSYRLG